MRSMRICIDVIRVQDTEIYGADDPTVLEWAAKANRILLTRDVNTMIGFAYDQIREGLPMPGVIEIPQNIPVGQAISELERVRNGKNNAHASLRWRFKPLAQRGDPLCETRFAQGVARNGAYFRRRGYKPWAAEADCNFFLYEHFLTAHPRRERHL